MLGLARPISGKRCILGSITWNSPRSHESMHHCGSLLFWCIWEDRSSRVLRHWDAGVLLHWDATQRNWLQWASMGIIWDPGQLRPRQVWESKSLKPWQWSRTSLWLISGAKFGPFWARPVRSDAIFMPTNPTKQISPEAFFAASNGASELLRSGFSKRVPEKDRSVFPEMLKKLKNENISGYFRIFPAVLSVSGMLPLFIPACWLRSPVNFLPMIGYPSASMISLNAHGLPPKRLTLEDTSGPGNFLAFLGLWLQLTSTRDSWPRPSQELPIDPLNLLNHLHAPSVLLLWYTQNWSLYMYIYIYVQMYIYIYICIYIYIYICI